MASVFLDADVAYDAIGKRDPFYKGALEIMKMADRGLISISISEVSMGNLIYLAFETYKLKNAADRLMSFITYCDVYPSGKRIFIEALNSDFKDKEDAVQYYTAVHHEVDYFITRNKKDYSPFVTRLPVFTPTEFLDSL